MKQEGVETKIKNKATAPWHSLDVDEVLEALQTTRLGLSIKEAAARLKHYGYNEVKDSNKRTPLSPIYEDLKSPLTIILFLAALFSFSIGDTVDSLVILAVIVINSSISFAVAYKADQALKSLKELSADKANVFRDGKLTTVYAREMVLGDVVIVRAGEKVPADLRLIKSDFIEVDESLLTGEPYPVRKTEAKMDIDTEKADRINILYSGSTVVAGSGEAVVVATGKNAFFGQLSFRIGSALETQTPLERRIGKFSKQISAVIFGIAVVIAIVALFRHLPFTEAVLFAVAVAISAIPEGLPAITSIALAIGVHRMAKENAIVHRMSAVETLGCVTKLAIDKTGTITENCLKVDSVYDADGKITLSSKEGNYILKLASTASEEQNKKAAEPLERAVAEKIVVSGKRLDFMPFSSDFSASAALAEIDGQKRIIVKGAPEMILRKSTFYLESGKRRVLNTDIRRQILGIIEQGSAASLRMIAVAEKQADNEKEISKKDICNLIFVGLIGFCDPIRESAATAIKDIQNAGISISMLTGDHRSTAHSVADTVGLRHDMVYQGRDLQSLSSVREAVKDEAIYARITPDDKFALVKAWQKAGEVVAVSGDGINDAPALKQADVGIAMGVGGTDVARKAADLVLLDNDLKTFTAAIKEGRTIYLNIQRSILYLLSTNGGEMFVMLAALLMGWPLPLLAVQILWINIVTDGSAGFALALEPAHHSVLKEEPRPKDESLITPLLLRRIMVVATATALITLVVQAFYMSFGRTAEEMRAAVFLVLASLQIWNMFNCRSLIESVIRLTLSRRPAIMFAFISSIALSVVTIYLPIFQHWFHVAALPPWQAIILILLGALIIPVVEWEKKYQ